MKNHDKFASVLASNREFSKNAIYYYYGVAHVSGGSSRTPTGYVQLPANLQSQFGGCTVVTLKTLGQVAEGVNTAPAALALAEQHGVDTPITREVCAVLFEGKSAQEALKGLLSRDPKRES